MYRRGRMGGGLTTRLALYSFRKVNGSDIKFAVTDQTTQGRFADREGVLVRLNDVINGLPA